MGQVHWYGVTTELARGVYRSGLHKITLAVVGVCGVPNSPAGFRSMMESFRSVSQTGKTMSTCSHQKSLSLKVGLTCEDDARAQG